MKRYASFLALLVLLSFSSCNPREAVEEPDYDNMVMVEDEEEWTTGHELDGKTIAGDSPQLQEHSILEIPGAEKEGCFEELR